MNEPVKRIKWGRLPYQAVEDKATLLAWEHFQITTEKAIRNIMKTNDLEELDVQTFIENAHWLGYRRRTIE